MSVNWGTIIATPTPTALTPLVALSARVSEDLKEMESTAQVRP